jgi:hypothetical protein
LIECNKKIRVLLKPPSKGTRFFQAQKTARTEISTASAPKHDANKTRSDMSMNRVEKPQRSAETDVIPAKDYYDPGSEIDDIPGYTEIDFGYWAFKKKSPPQKSEQKKHTNLSKQNN